MTKFRVYKCLSIIFGVFALLGLFSFNAIINNEISVSIEPILIEKCAELELSLVELQDYVLLFTEASAVFCALFTFIAFGVATKKLKKATNRTTTNEVHVNTNKEVEIMRKQELKALKEQAKLLAKEAKAKIKEAVEAKKAETKTETTEENTATVTETKAQTAADAKINDILNSI